MPLNSHLSSSFVNSANSLSRPGCSTLGPVSGDMNRVVLNSTTNSGPSVGASSLVTDANSALSGGPHLQRSASINTESYTRLPASPMSFSSNNLSISGSSVMDGSSIVQQSSRQDHSPQQMQQRQQGTSTATSQLTSRAGQVPVPNGSHISNSLAQETHYLSQLQKKPRLDPDVLQHQVIQQMLQRQDSMQLNNPQVQALLQQQRLQRQQLPQQMLQTLPPLQLQRAHLQQQMHQQQLRQHVQHQGIPPTSAVKRPYESGVCARRLMQYIYHQRHRPADNTIVYWRKFVAEYFAPRAKKRWCLSLYDNVGQHALGVFPQATMEPWHCDICNTNSGKGFEATFEVLPRLNKVKFDSGVLDELLFLDMPRECRFHSGVMMLEYGKAVQESVYDQLRVIREGQLRIVFTPELKILSWEFCARRHEELLPRRSLAPQVNQLLQVAQKYQNTVMESASTGPSTQDLQENCNMFVTAGRQLAKTMELQTLNDLGFSKRYVRCLQISEVVNSMKDLIDYSREQSVGPIESLKNYPRRTTAAKQLQMQKMQEIEQQTGTQGLPNDRSTLNKMMAMHPGLSGHMNNNHHMVGNGVLSTSSQNAALGNYQNLLRQNTMSSNPNGQQEPSPLNGSIQGQSSPFQGSVTSAQASMQTGGMSSPHSQQQQQSPLTNMLLQQNNPQSSQGNQSSQQHMLQQLLHDMMSTGGGRGPQHHQANGPLKQDTSGTGNGGLSAKAGSTGMVSNGAGFGNNDTASVSSMSGDITGVMNNRSNSFKSNTNNNSGVGGGNDNFNLKDQDVLSNLHLPEMVQDITNEFPDWDV